MDRIVLLGLDGLSAISSRDDLEAYPAFQRLLMQAAKGSLENELPCSRNMAWKLALCGSMQAVEAGKCPCKTLPARGISVACIHTAPQAGLSAEEILANDVNSVLAGIPNKPVDRKDLLIINLEGYSAFLQQGGDADVYVQALDEALQKLLAGLSDNSIYFVVEPVALLESETGIGINAWLAENGKGAHFEADSCLLSFPQGDPTLREETLGALKGLKVYAKRGGDLKIVECQRLPEAMLGSKSAPESVYLAPKKESVYLDAEAGELEVRAPRYYYGTDGLLFISGYKVDESRELQNVSLLSIAPTILDCLNLDRDWDMVRYSIKAQFSLRVFEEQASAASGNGDENAVRSRLEALGY